MAASRRRARGQEPADRGVELLAAGAPAEATLDRQHARAVQVRRVRVPGEGAVLEVALDVRRGMLRAMLSVTEATARVLELVPRLAAEDVELAAADGRVLAAAIDAGRDLPAVATSAMDGFAARAAELPARLPVVRSIGAGVVGAHIGALAAGGAARIMTGAPLPAGADTVVMFEDARGDDGRSIELPASPVGANVRPIGEDLGRGERAVEAGARIGWRELGLLAALGCARVRVARRPVVAIIATGDELVDIATPPAPGQVVDSSAYVLAAQIAAAGGVSRYLGIARDRREDVAAMIAQALTADVVVTTGGVSVGDHDHVKPALASLGVELDFWKVAMKPGKPLAVGRHGAVPIFALPGNPVSSAVAFELFVRPALLAMQGAAATARPRAPVVLPDGYRKPPGRAHYLRARLRRAGERLIAELHPKQGSAILSSLVCVDALVEVAAEQGVIEAGGTTPALLLAAV
jgi:molybdopterin molybdotransferase